MATLERVTFSAFAPYIGISLPTWIGVFVVVVAVVVLRLFLESRLKTRRSVPQEAFQFNLKRKNFFTKSEVAFYRQLLGVLHGQPFAVFPKVRLADLFDVTGDENRLKARNKITQKHVDYVIVALPTCQPVFAIELDGPSHDSARQRAKDADKDAAFQAAGMPLIRVRTEEKPDLERLKSTLSPYLTLEARVGQQRTAEPVRANAQR